MHSPAYALYPKRCGRKEADHPNPHHSAVEESGNKRKGQAPARQEPETC